MRKATVVTLFSLATVVLAACSSSPSHPASVQTTTSTNAANVAAQFMSDLNPEVAANEAYIGAVGLINADTTKQSQKIALDNAAITSNEFGAGCTISTTDPSSYSNCLSSEQQTAANARSDLASAQGQEDQDVAQYASANTTYSTAITTFIGQLIALPWPSQYKQAVNAVVTTARAFRTDLANASAISTSTPSSIQSSINARVTTDGGNFNDALSALKARLGQAQS